MKTKAAKIAELATQRDPWEAPGVLTAAEGAIWDDVVASVAGDHFAQGDQRALIDWCRAQARIDVLVSAQRRIPIGTKDDHKRQTAAHVAREISGLRSVMISLTRILRLGPSSRPDARDRKTAMPTRNPSKARKAAAKAANGAPIDSDELLP